MRKLVNIILLLIYTQSVFAQHGKDHKAVHDSLSHSMIKSIDAQKKMACNLNYVSYCDTTLGKPLPMYMSSAVSLELPMNRNGSGTSWMPDSTPVYGYMFHGMKWIYMIQGNLFVRYDKQDLSGTGKRGGSKIDAPNYGMFMGQRRVGEKGLFHFNTMISLEPLTESGNGYPLLFQTGETWNNAPLVDRQHPHDLLSELSASYSYAFSKNSEAFVYVGYPGEPALGSSAFMHRPSAMYDPDAPISHHWNDGTHVTYGVATFGYRLNKFKIEASSFTGREPDENRYDFDKATFDSWSGRFSYNPNNNISLQASHGYLKSPDVLHPEENMNQTTISAIATHSVGSYKHFDVMGLWAQNKSPGVANAKNALLGELALRIYRLAVYARFEWVQKSAEELNLNMAIYGRDSLFNLTVTTLGIGYDLFNIGVIKVAGGAQLSFCQPDDNLKWLYGNYPLSGEIYLHFYPRVL